MSELSRELGVAKSSLHGILTTMRDRGFVVQDPVSRRFRLGPQVLAISAGYDSHDDLLVAFEQIAPDVQRRCGETVQLATRHGRYALYLAHREGSPLLRLAPDRGTLLPAHLTGLGKALLSALSPAEIEALFAGVTLERRTPHSLATLDDLMQDLAESRVRGYTIDHGESTDDIRCVAAPVYGPAGAAVAAISIAVPAFRFNDSRRDELAGLVREAASDLSRRLGHRDGNKRLAMPAAAQRDGTG